MPARTAPSSWALVTLVMLILPPGQIQLLVVRLAPQSPEEAQARPGRVGQSVADYAPIARRKGGAEVTICSAPLTTRMISTSTAVSRREFRQRLKSRRAAHGFGFFPLVKAFRVLSPSSTKNTPPCPLAAAIPKSDPAPVTVSTVTTATCAPCGVTSTRFPSPPFATTTSPLGAIRRPNGTLIAPPTLTSVPPAPSDVVRAAASAIAATR